MMGSEGSEPPGRVMEASGDECQRKTGPPAAIGCWGGLPFWSGKVGSVGLGLAGSIFKRGVDHRHSHDRHQRHDRLGRLEEQGGSHEQWILQEAESTLDLCWALAVGVDGLLVHRGQRHQCRCGHDEATLRCNRVAWTSSREASCPSTAERTASGSCACRAAFPGMLVCGTIPPSWTSVSVNSWRKPPGPLSVRRAGEALSAEAVNRLPFDFARFCVLPAPGRLSLERRPGCRPPTSAAGPQPRPHRRT